MHLIFQLNRVLFLSLVLTACGGGGGSGGTTPGVTIDDSKLVPGCFSASGSNPLLTTGSQFSTANWNDPSVIKVGDSYVMYASADINFSQDIKNLSAHFKRWRQLDIKPDQTLYPRATYRGYSTPAAVVINNKMHLFYDVAEDPFVQTKIHHAVSDDGISGFVQDNQEIFDRNMFAITSSEINGPSPLLDGTQLKLYFAGRVGLDLSIALSNCDLASP